MPAQYRQAATAVWRRAHGMVLVLPQGANDVVVLTDTGEDIWWTLAEPKTVDEAAYELAEIYGAPLGAIKRDVTPVLDDLVVRGVLDRAAR